MPDAAAPRAGGNFRRRDQEQCRAPPSADRRDGLYQRRLRHPLARAPGLGRLAARRRPTSQRTRPPAHEITAQMLLRAYALGIFPMAERRDDDEIYWVDPERRGIHLLRQKNLRARCS